MSQKHIQNEDIKELIDVGGDHSRLPSSSKVATLQFSNLKTLADILQERLIHGQPLQMHQSYPANTLLTIEPSEIQTFEGKKSATPIKSQIPTVPLSTINFQTGATTGATFDLTFPDGIVTERVLLGLTLLTDGTIKGLFSTAYTLVRPNPGTLFVRGGLPLGFLELEWTNATPGRFKTVGALGNTIENAGVYLFGSGGGSGGGEGNANDLYIEFKKRLDETLFGWFTSNIALDDEDTLIDDANSTAIYDIANSLFAFSTVGSILQSIQQYGGSFLGTNALRPDDGFRENIAVELHAKWSVDDPLATYEVSRDGGLNWLALVMERIGGSFYYTGEGKFLEPVVTENLIEYQTAVTPTTVDLDQTVLKRAVKVIITEKSKYQTVALKYNKTGTPAGLLTLTWVKDNAGEPSDEQLASTIQVVSALAAGPNSIDIEVPTILPPGTYWLTIEGDADYRASYVNGATEVALQADSAGTYAGGVSYQYDGTLWTPTAGIQILFGTSGFRYKLLVRVTSGTVDSSIEGYAVFFGEEGGAVEPNVEEPQYFRFSGSLDQTEFEITNFWPNPKRVRATFVNSGLTFIHPFFDVIGNKLVFQSGTFLYPGTDLILKVENTELGGSANVDLAKINSLLAENALGSEVPTLDMSQAGKGFKLRRPDGTLRMVRLDNNDDLIVESLP